MASSTASPLKPLTAAEVIAHPAFNASEWDLPPTKAGKCSVAKGRSGGPFNLWYEVHGTGQTKIVWIMGLGAFSSSWKRQTKYFGHTHSSTYSSLVFDNRGIARSDKPTCRYSTSEMALDIIDLLTELNWYSPTPSPSSDSSDDTNPKRDLNIIGVSMGGMIAQELALMIPEHIQSLCLVSTAPRLVRTIPFLQNLRERINMFIPRDIDVQLDDVAHRILSDSFLAMPDTDQSDPKLNYPTNRDRFACGELHKRRDREGFTRKGFTLQAIAAGWHYKSPEQIARIGDMVGRRRIVVMHGTNDHMITFSHQQLFKDELGDGPEYRVWEGSGHVLLWEEQHEFNACVEAVIQRTREN